MEIIRISSCSNDEFVRENATKNKSTSAFPMTLMKYHLRKKRKKTIKLKGKIQEQQRILHKQQENRSKPQGSNYFQCQENL